MLLACCAEGQQDGGPGDPGVGGDGQGVAGVVVEPGQDLVFMVIMFPDGCGHGAGAWVLRVLVSIPAGAWGAGVRMTRREMMSPASTTAAPTSKAAV